MSDIGHAVSKAIDVDYSRLDPAVARSFRLQRRQPDDVCNFSSQLSGFDAQRKGGGDGSEDIAAIEGRADGMTKIFGVSEMKYLGRHAFVFLALTNVAKDSIVGANKESIAALDQYWTAR